ESSDQTCPTGLMARAQAGPVVGVEIFEKIEVIAPLWIGLKLLVTSVNRPYSVFVRQKDCREAVGNILADIKQVHQVVRTGRERDLQCVAIVQVKIQESANDQDIKG